MKKLLALLFISTLLLSCSSSDDNNNDGNLFPLSYQNLKGSWSTGLQSYNRYLDFETDSTGFYALYNGAKLISSYTFNYKISNNKIVTTVRYSESLSQIGKLKEWNCQLTKNKLVITTSDEAGTYNKLNQ